MSLILSGSGGGGRGSVAALNNLYVRGDDDGAWYTVGLTYDTGLGFWRWDVGSAGSAPDNSVNISDRVLGTAFFILDGDGDWHTFNMTPTDPAQFGYVWTDVDQSASSPAVFSTRRDMRADDGFYITDIEGRQIHKMGVSGGLWTELTQGLTIPM